MRCSPIAETHQRATVPVWSIDRRERKLDSSGTWLRNRLI
jgi:hypothetical protein